MSRDDMAERQRLLASYLAYSAPAPCRRSLPISKRLAATSMPSPKRRLCRPRSCISAERKPGGAAPSAGRVISLSAADYLEIELVFLVTGGGGAAASSS